VAFFVSPGKGGILSDRDVQTGRRQATSVVLGQAAIGASVALVCLAGLGPRAGASALVGAGIGVAATSLMAFALLRHRADASAGRVALSFFSGWLVKVGLTVALLVLAFRSPRVEPVPMLVAYVATFLGYWLGAARASKAAAGGRLAPDRQ